MAPQEGSAFWAPFATGTWGSRPRRARKCARPGPRPAVPQPRSPRPGARPGVRPTGKRRGWRSRARAPPLGQEARVRPGPQLTPGPAEGVEGVQAREGDPALPRTAWAAGLSGTHAAGTWTWGAFPGGAGPWRQQADAKWSPSFPEGTAPPGEDLKPARIWHLLGGVKRGSLLPTTLRFHEGEKGTEKPSYPSEVTQPGQVVGPGGWERRAEGEWQVGVRAPKVERKDLAGRRASFLAGRVGGQAGPSEDLGARIPHRLTAWLAPGPDLPGAIQPDRTLPTGGEPPQLLECIEPHPQDRPQGHPETPHRWKQISRFLSLVPAGSGSGGSAQMPPPPGSPPDSNACEPDGGCKRSSCQG